MLFWLNPHKPNPTAKAPELFDLRLCRAAVCLTQLAPHGSQFVTGRLVAFFL